MATVFGFFHGIEKTAQNSFPVGLAIAPTHPMPRAGLIVFCGRFMAIIRRIAQTNHHRYPLLDLQRLLVLIRNGLQIECLIT